MITFSDISFAESRGFGLRLGLIGRAFFGRRAVGGNRPYRSLYAHKPNSEGGSVLIIVMVVCIGLVSVALYFGHSTAMVYRGSASDLAGRQAQRAIDGAAQYAEYLMVTSGTANSSASTGAASGSSSMAGSGSAPATYLLPQSTTYQGEAVQVGDATFWFIGDALASGSSTSSSGGPGSNVPSYGLVDEASKLNLNTASLQMLEQLPNMTTSLAQAIVAWRTSTGTSSSSNTTTTSTSGSSKGGQFESIYELAQLAQADGDDPSILYGNDPNLNHILDNSESQGAAQFTPGLYEYVTVFSREPKYVPGTSTMRISVTTQKGSVASSGSTSTTSSTTSSGSSAPTTLSGLLNSMLGQNRAAEIMANLGLVAAGGGGGGARGGGRAQPAAATGPGSVLEFYIRGKLTEPELNELTPYIVGGTGTTPYKNGLVNVNTASETVLECVPGITPGIASQIVSTRQGQATPYTDLAWLVPLFGDNATGHAAAYKAGPYLTTQTFQVSADVAAVGTNGLGYRRTLFVIDGSNGTPQIVYRHDMTPLGWALGPNALQSLNGTGGQKTSTP